jgi:uncharacterized protein YlaI
MTVISSRVGKCALCHKIRELRQSHIIPKQISRWIKRDAPGTLFVNLETKRTRQDISKRRLFCDDCERRLSRSESRFRQAILVPYYGRCRVNFPRDEWLTRFATSLAFRVGHITLPGLASSVSADRHQRAREMLERWRVYLLSVDGTPPPSVHELYFLDGRRVVPPRDIPAEVTSRYLVQTIDPTFIAGPGVMGVYTKILSMLFWAPIEPSDRTGWRGTRINGTGTIRAQKQEVNAPFLARLLRERTRLIAIEAGLL